MSTIVVGADGSAGAIAALSFAIAEAKVRGCDVKAVSAWHVPSAAYQSGWVMFPINVTDFEELGKTALEKTLEGAEAGSAGVEITKLVREGQAAEVLVAEAKGAELLVVGSRGLGGFRGLMLGSTSQQCAHHTPCPLAIIPPPPAV